MADLHYVAYGSNVAAVRFECYLRGGRPPGARTHYPGCADPTRAGGPVPLIIPHRLAFDRWSPRWEGGVAVLDPRPGSGSTLAVAWTLSWDQLADVCAQECTQRRAEPPDRDAVAELARRVRDGEVAPGTRFRLRPAGWYADALVLAPVRGTPAITLTSELCGDHHPPSAEYLGHLRTGLAAVHRLEPDEVDGYLASLLDRSAR